MTSNKLKIAVLSSSLTLFVVCPAVCGSSSTSAMRVVNAGGKIMVEFDGNLRSRIVSGLDKKIVLGPFSNSEFVSVNGKIDTSFALSGFNQKDWKDSLGRGKEYEITGSSENLLKRISIVCYDDFPTMVFFKVAYQNVGKKSITVNGWTNNNYVISTLPAEHRNPAFWSYQPGSYGWDNNWIMPLEPGYARDNYLGMTFDDYGGGTPVADVWRPDYGIAVGHVEMVPKFVSLPVRMVNKHEAMLGISFKKDMELAPGSEFSTLRTFVEVHKGDHYNSLTVYRQFMERQGIRFKDAPESAYGNEWCGWGYEQNFTMEEIYNTLPKVKELGLDWVVLDMGWYKGMGDYFLAKEKFPSGDEDMRKFVEKVHSYGLKVQLWWMPLAVALKTDLMAQHPDYLLLNEDGSPRFMPSFFKSFFLCPASPEVQEYSKQQVIRFMQWGFDGLKIDGDNQNCVPACYNPDHHHLRPEESLEALPSFYNMVFETALSINPDAKIEICPCGTNQSFFLMPFMNETVASDPHTSWQIRLKGKTLRALTGEKSVFYGDHVELSDDRSDFASTIGVGGVIGTKFVYPPGVYMNTESGDVSLTPEKEAMWKKWIKICNENMLSKGKYRGELYDIGFDRPETHAIQKGDTMYYALYAPEYAGEIALRGLEKREYRIIDYEHNVGLGVLKGPVDTMSVSFKNHLLLKAEPR
jgi:alpha-galactosidase